MANRYGGPSDIGLSGARCEEGGGVERLHGHLGYDEA